MIQSNQPPNDVKLHKMGWRIWLEEPAQGGVNSVGIRLHDEQGQPCYDSTPLVESCNVSREDVTRAIPLLAAFCRFLNSGGTTVEICKFADRIADDRCAQEKPRLVSDMALVGIDDITGAETVWKCSDGNFIWISEDEYWERLTPKELYDKVSNDLTEAERIWLEDQTEQEFEYADREADAQPPIIQSEKDPLP